MLRVGVDILRALARTTARCLWPAKCVLCGQSAVPGARQDVPDYQGTLDLCAGCVGDLPLNHHFCEHCAEPLPVDCDQPALCPGCLQHPPVFDACAAPFRYAFPVDRMIHALKYRGELTYGRVLGELLARHLYNRGTRPDVVIPVPLGTARYRERGFNQARELALPVCRSLGLSLRSDLVMRLRETKEQAGLDRNERLKNMTSAFALAAPLGARHIAIIDDVVTTGSTVNELAKVLRAAGAEWIEVWCIARADPQRKVYSSTMPMNTDMPK